MGRGRNFLDSHNVLIRHKAHPQGFGPNRQATSLVVIEPESPRAHLRSQNSVLLAQIVDDFLLLVIHPAGNSDQQQAKRVQGLWHPQSLALICSLP